MLTTWTFPTKMYVKKFHALWGENFIIGLSTDEN